MNRKQITAECRSMLGEVAGTDGAGNPFSWDRYIDDAQDELCQATDALFYGVGSALTEGRRSYCAPSLYKLRRCEIKTPDMDAPFGIPLVSARELDQCGDWHADPPTGTPQYAIPQGMNSILLYPTPDADAPNGLRLYGYGTKSGLWPNPEDECPLPIFAHMGVVYGACKKRIIEFPTPVNQVRHPMLTAEFTRVKRKLEAEAMNYTRAAADRAPLFFAAGGLIVDGAL